MNIDAALMGMFSLGSLMGFAIGYAKGHEHGKIAGRIAVRRAERALEAERRISEARNVQLIKAWDHK